MVGAGGIGCELLKNLVMMGFERMEVIDLDTIDLSNLNRQFLFRNEHIGLSKAEVARESVLRFNSRANIVAHHGDVTDARFGPSYVKGFDIVLNALDNLGARRHVNRLCLAAGVPLVESGTGGYLGQVQPIKAGTTECFDCRPKQVPKEYASCTINNTPSKPIHCIVWGKAKFGDYFAIQGAEKEEEIVKEVEEKKQEEKWEDEKIIEEDKRLAAQLQRGFEYWLFHKLFHRDVYYQVRVGEITEKNVWKGRPPPVPLTLLVASGEDGLQGEDAEARHVEGLPDREVWTLRDNARVFLNSVRALKKAKVPLTGFDKDHLDCLNFVTSAANLRCHVFGIPRMSRFDAKAEAGNIIPAIATTNAVIAGMIVLEAIRILEDRLDQCKFTYLLKRPSGKRMLLPVPWDKPNPNCFVCATNCITLEANTSTLTLKEVVDGVLRQQLNMVEPVVLLDNDILYEDGADLEEDEKVHNAKQAAKALKELRMVHNCIVHVEDELQGLTVDITILHCDAIENGTDGDGEEVARKFILKNAGDIKTQKKISLTAEEGDNGAEEGFKKIDDDDDDDLVIVEMGKETQDDEVVAGKRKREQGDTEADPKRRRTSSAAKQEDVVMLD